MKTRKNITLVVAVLAIIIIPGLMSCKKLLQDKPDSSLSLVTSLKDMQALMDYYPTVNFREAGSGEASSDDYFLTSADWAARTEQERRLYLWEGDNIFAAVSNPWRDTFQPVFLANTVLQSLEAGSKDALGAGYDDIKGQALFIRAKCYLQAAAIWCLAYDPIRAENTLGLPLRLDPDYDIPSVRSNLAQTFAQIESDLLEAARLLPEKPLHVMRGSKGAAYGLLSRLYLYMGRYPLAGEYASKGLSINSTLIDYNSLSTTAGFPLAQFNPEVIYASHFSTPAQLTQARARISDGLLSFYATEDLRRNIFFKAGTSSTTIFKGSYEGSASLFCGVATDELLLNLAEAKARDGNATEALALLNSLRIKRIKKANYSPLSGLDAAAALEQVLLERRRELVFRGIRWMDIKRLNKEGREITLKRTLDGKEYVLLPNDPRYALAIPEDVIRLSGMQQNPR